MQVIYNAIGHEIIEGAQAYSAKCGDLLRVKKARKSYKCNDCKESIEVGELQGSPTCPPFSRHVCKDCLRNRSAYEFEQQPKKMAW